MKNNRLLVVLASIIALIVVAVAAMNLTQKPTSGAGSPVAGDLAVDKHYRVLSQPLQVAGDGISVIEFFWYGCPHCRDFEPRIKQWLASAPEDIRFEMKPIVWNDATGLHAAMYYAGLEASDSAALHDALFEQIIDIRKERNLDRHIDSVSRLFSQYGVSESQLTERLNSQEILQQVRQAESDMRQAEVSSTPSVLIGGKYLILNNSDVGDKGLFNVMETLIELERQSQS